jgi:hypothetical protein
MGTNASRIFLVSLRPTYSQKMKLKARNQLGMFPRKNKCVIHCKQKRFFTKPKKDLTAGTAAKPLMVWQKDGFVWNFFLVNGKNGFVHKVPYETFISKCTKGFVCIVLYRTFIKKKSRRFRIYGSVQNLSKNIRQKVLYKWFCTKPFLRVSG